MNLIIIKIEIRVVVFMLFLYSILPVLGQCEQKDIFEIVPSQVRERLVERMKLRIEYEKTEQWERLYDLLYPPESNQEEKTRKKKEYVRINTDPTNPRRYLMVDFKPKNITKGYLNNLNTYLIEGCATIRFNGKLIKENDIIIAHLLEGEWYFSSFGNVAPNKVCE